MIPVQFNPDDLSDPQKQEWSTWQEKATQSTKAALQAWEDWQQSGAVGKFQCPFQDKVWGELKDWLIKNVFADKCAYCETREVRSPYHAEHFRPKGRVRFKPQGRTKLLPGRTKDAQNQDIDHPGYFWLAYHWQNLLPSCNDCNSARGKNDQFPISNSYIAVQKLMPEKVNKLRKPPYSLADKNLYLLEPEDLNDLEIPLLLHPYFDNPADHLIFGEFGVVAALEDPTTGKPSLKGQHSIQVYNLDADSLARARQSAQENAFQTYANEFTRGRNLSKTERINAAKAAIAGYMTGQEPYSAAVMGYLRIMFPDHRL
jgi:hypothetical protein